MTNGKQQQKSGFTTLGAFQIFFWKVKVILRPAHSWASCSIALLLWAKTLQQTCSLHRTNGKYTLPKVVRRRLSQWVLNHVRQVRWSELRFYLETQHSRLEIKPIFQGCQSMSSAKLSLDPFRFLEVPAAPKGTHALHPRAYIAFIYFLCFPTSRGTGYA